MSKIGGSPYLYESVRFLLGFFEFFLFAKNTLAELLGILRILDSWNAGAHTWQACNSAGPKGFDEMTTETATAPATTPAPVQPTFLGEHLDLATEIAKLPEVVRQAIEGGHIIADVWTVEMGKKAAQNPTGKDLVSEYLRLLAQDVQGMAARENGLMRPAVKPVDEKGNVIPKDKWTPEQVIAATPGVADFYNYGKDLDDKSEVKQRMIRLVEGPEKAIKTAYAGLIAGGFDKDEALGMLRNMPKFKGVEGLDVLLARVSA